MIKGDLGKKVCLVKRLYFFFSKVYEYLVLKERWGLDLIGVLSKEEEISFVNEYEIIINDFLN